MEKNEALLSAVKNAIEALEAVKAELEKEVTPEPEKAKEVVLTFTPASEAAQNMKPMLTLEPKITAESKPEPSASVSNICPKCGKPVVAGYKFCMGCGTPLSQSANATATQQDRVCANCGAPLGSNDKFCMKCGAKN